MGEYNNKDLWMDAVDGKLYTIGPYSLEFPNKYVNKPQNEKCSLIYESEPFKIKGFILFPGNIKMPSIIEGKLNSKYDVSMLGNLIIKHNSSNDGKASSHKIFKGEIWEIAKPLYLNKTRRIYPKDTISVFIKSKEIIDHTKSNLAIKCLQALEQKKPIP